METVNRDALAEKVAQRNGLTKAQVKRVLDDLETVVVNEVRSGNTVMMRGFISIEPVKRAAHTGRNPSTGAPIDIPEKTVPKAKARFDI